MINTTPDGLVFHSSGSELSGAIREALQATARKLLELHDLSDIDLNRVTTKTNQRVLFSKFVLLNVLTNKGMEFDSKYVEAVFKLYQQRKADDAEELFYRFLGTDKSAVAYRKSYSERVPQGAGYFLIKLHSMRVITLPTAFDWPSARVPGGWEWKEIGKHFSSELLAFIRCLDGKDETLPDPAFEAVGLDKNRRKWFSCYGTKLLLATGWHTPEDINLADLVQLQQAKSCEKTSSSGVLPFKILVDVLWRKYGTVDGFTPENWTKSMLETSFDKRRVSRYALTPIDDQSRDEFEEAVQRLPYEATPRLIRRLGALPGLSLDLRALSSKWLDLEESYLRKRKVENYKQLVSAMGLLNIYLFLYLPYWFSKHPEAAVRFPDTPEKLLAVVFVTRVANLEGAYPKTFMELADAMHAERAWDNNSYYGRLKQVEKFFAYLERYSDDLPGCKGFRQPLASDDYPTTTSKYGTNKRPLGRRHFRVFLEYVEALIAYSDAVTDRILSGSLDSRKFAVRIAKFGHVIDTFQMAEMVGFVPILFHKGKTFPLRVIPQCMPLTKALRVKGKPGIRIPMPHALNQIFVALHTGLRHNHIQWLDERTFDMHVTDDELEFARLLANTDKRKNGPWTPHVNRCVIDRLRAQRTWRNLIDEPGFAKEQRYNGNKRTKWPPILPLFAASSSGKPHNDETYERAWDDVLGAVQGLLTEIGEASYKEINGKKVWTLCTLEPPTVTYMDPDADKKRQEIGDYYGNRRMCKYGIKSEITPHSARVSVVGALMPFLPAELIGKYITGQTTRVVYHYWVPDPEDIEKEQVHQALAHKNKSLHDVDELLKSGADRAVNRAVRPDDVNSNLSRSLRKDVSETLEAHGCVSLSLADSEVNGLVVIRETRAINAVGNLTEICPYGNRCPPHVVKVLGKPHRCAVCSCAVRSVDHLPPVSIKVKQVKEELDELTERLRAEETAVVPRYTSEEFDDLEKERFDLADELTSWRLAEEVLYVTYLQVKSGQDTRRWVVQKPEVIERDLQRVAVPDSLTAYTLTRLQECIVYPTLESPQIRARFDLMRRQLLAGSGRINEALASAIPVNPAAECAGVLKTISESHNLTVEDIAKLLDGDSHLEKFPARNTPLLTGND